MRTVRRLATGHDFAISELRIVRDTPAWTAPEPVPDQRLVFVRRGVFRLRVDGWWGVADPLLAYVGQPGAEQSIAHRPGAEDVCTVITLPADGSLDRGFRAVHTTGRSWLAHRVLVARARAGAEEFELSERISALAGDLLQLQAISSGSAPVDCRLSIVCSRQSTGLSGGWRRPRGRRWPRIRWGFGSTYSPGRSARRDRISVASFGG